MRRIFSAACVFILMAASSAAGQPRPAQFPSPAAEKRALPKSLARMDGELRRIVTEPRAARTAGQRPEDIATNRVPVTIRFRTGASAADRRNMLATLNIAPANDAPGIVEAYVPVAALEALSLRPEVEAVEAIVPPRPRVLGQGRTVHNATSWQGAGRTGAGVKVGIIDGGFVGLTALIGTELPVVITARCYVGIGSFSSALSACESGTDHGTAVSEAVADIAPGVQLYIANPMSHLDLRNTVDWMTSQGVRVINHSVGWTWSGPGDGTTPFADAPLRSVDRAVSNGAVWMNAAGNEALATWSGAFREVASGCEACLEFAPGIFANGVSLRGGEEFFAQARWEDSWTAAARDLDLYLVDPSGEIVAGSTAFQDGTPGRAPRELFSFTPPADGVYFLVVHRFSGSHPGWVDVQSFTGQRLEYATGAHSIANPAETANPGAMAVGAAPWFDTSRVESFSSRGPTRDGRIKPDIVAADRADSATYGPNGFAGTSQAAPHATGLAALVIAAFPASSPELVAKYLRTVAAPRGAPGNSFGAGFAQVPAFPATVGLSAFLTTATFPASRGGPVTWTAFGIGAQTPFEYKFWQFREPTGWTLLQDYSPSNVLNWTPPAEGTYSLQVWVRRVGSTAAYDDWRGTDALVIDAAAPIAVAPPVANRTSPVSYGIPITWTVNASGGVAPLMYQFWRLQEGVGWSLARDYSPVNTFTWIPAASEAGTHHLQVWVRSAGSTAPYDAWAQAQPLEILGPPPLVVTSLSADVSFPAITGTPIRWTATVTGGLGDREYKFWRFKQGEGWTVVRDYATANSFTWTPSALDVGSYAMQVWVRRVGSSAAFDAWRGTETFVIAAPPPVRLTGLTQSPSGAATVGMPIAWSATATGGVAPLQYKFWLNSGGTWTVLQDYSPLSTVTWTPLVPGTYTAQVWVRSAGSSAAYEDWGGTASFTVDGSATPFVSSLDANVTFPAMTGTPITWTATAGGGMGPLQYQFWRFRQGAGWSIAQAYSSQATYTWTPTESDNGSYALQVWVRSAGSTASYEDWKGTAPFDVVPSTILAFHSVPGDYVGGGLTRVITGGDFSAQRNFDNGVNVNQSTFPGGFWHLNFAAPGDAEVTTGLYNDATRWPFHASNRPGLDVSGDGRGCNQSVGRFNVREAVYASNGSIERFAADFEQHCEGAAAGLYGSIRWRSTVPLVGVRTITVHTSSPTAVGVPVTWNAGVVSGREYRTWLYRRSTRTWLPLQGYFHTPIATWTPLPGDQGEWSVVIWERPIGSSVDYENWIVSGTITVGGS